MAQEKLDSMIWKSELTEGGPFVEKDMMGEVAIMELSRCAATWVVVLDMEHPIPSATSHQAKPRTNQVIVTAAKLSDLNRGSASGVGKLQVQTLVAGIAAPPEVVSEIKACHGSACRTCDLRPLALLTTAGRCGVPYKPLCATRSSGTMPPPANASPPGCPWSSPSCLFSPIPGPPLLLSQRRTKSGAEGVSALTAEEYEALLLGVPWWNVVERYNAQGSWKCYKSRSVTGFEVLSLLQQGRLDEMAPVLGVQHPLPPRMWLPSSLFLPLAAVREICFPTLDRKGPQTFYRYTPLSCKQLEDINQDNRLLYNRPQ